MLFGKMIYNLNIQLFLNFQVQSSSLSFPSTLTKAALFGPGKGTLLPLIPCHKTILNSKSGTASSFVRLNDSDLRCHSLMAIFVSFRSILAATDIKGVRSGVEEKQFHMGSAAASYCVMGGSPNINSIVRNMEEVEYME